MSYLAKLKSLDSEKCLPSEVQKLQKDPSDSEKCLPSELQKPQKDPFYSFCSTQDARFQKSSPANDEADGRHERWLVHYPGRVIETWVSPAASREEMLENRPGAISAEPIEERQTPEPTASCTACAHRPPGHQAGSPAPCGVPDKAGLGPVGTVRYRAHDGEGCPAFEPRLAPRLEARVRKMGQRWEYTPDDLERALEGARRDPVGWLRVVDLDERGGALC